jgi:hypothetical protein
MGAAVLVIPVYDAVIEAAPSPTASTNPPVTVAALEFDVLHVAVEVRFWVVPLL